MNKATVTQQAKTAGSLPPARGGILQRKCACGSHTIAGGECAECAKKKSGLQRKLTMGASNDPLEREAERVTGQVMAAPVHNAISDAPPHIQRYGEQSTGQMNAEPASVSPAFAGSGRLLEGALQQDMEQRFGHDFSQVYTSTKTVEPAGAVNASAYTRRSDSVFWSGQYIPETSALENGYTLPVHKNAAVDEEPAGDEPDSGGSGQEFPGQFLPSLLGEIPAAGEELMPGIEPLDEGNKKKAKCPSKTVVEKTIDMTPDGIKKGYRTGYGATAVMQVQPDSTNWDGTQIVESLKQTKNTCPEEFGISPCSGNSTFTVGAEAKSSVLGTLEAKHNRFYDFHISRWNKGSLLHDRNPADIDSCQVECEQSYSCDGGVIGKHTVTRTFTKGKSGSRDVTLVAVTKK